MEKSLLLYPLILTVLLSSACKTLEGLTSSEAKTLVEEGKTLVYEDSSGERSEVVFFNETEESIGVHIADETPETINVSKETWVSEQGLGDELFFSGLFSTLNQTKFSALMERGEQISFSEQVQLSRSDQIRWRSFKAYNISLEAEDEAMHFIVHAERPYLVMKNPESQELVSVNETESLQQYSLDQKPGETEAGFRDIRATSLGVSTVYRQDNQMNIQLRNLGERTVNLENLEIRYGPPGQNEPIRFNMLSRRTGWTVADNKCFTEERDLRPAEVYTCETGVKFPEPNQEIEIQVLAENFDYKTSYRCETNVEDSKTC